MIMLFMLAFIAACVAGIFGAFIIKVAPLLYVYRRRPASVGRRAAHDRRAAPRGGRGCGTGPIFVALTGPIISRLRPPFRPRVRVASSPAIVRSRIRSRSNSATLAKTWKTSLPPSTYTVRYTLAPREKFVMSTLPQCSHLRALCHPEGPPRMQARGRSSLTGRTSILLKRPLDARGVLEQVARVVGLRRCEELLDPSVLHDPALGHHCDLVGNGADKC